MFLFVALMRLKSTSSSFSPPTLTTLCSSRTRSRFACAGLGTSPISSRNNVPPLALSITPDFLPTAPVKAPASWLDFDEYERLVEVARSIDVRTLLVVLLGGDAGMRCGEILALEWNDVDLVKRQLCVRQSDWNGQVGTPKSGRPRYVPLTGRLTAALADHRHLRSKRVLCQTDGGPFTRQIVQNRMRLAAKRANVRRGIHILRHTFCSHLSMRGAPARAIQELAGHSDLTMTQRYMHLSPAALDSAIRLLDQPLTVQSFGDILETGRVSEGKING